MLGYAIKNATGEYCKNDKWLGLLKGCLACANEFNIWQYYGNKVGAAAKACGLDATPKPAGNGGSSSSAVAASSAPPASSAPAGSKAASTPAASTPAATHASGTPVAQSSAAQTAAGSSSAASAASSGHPAASSSAGHSNTVSLATTFKVFPSNKPQTTVVTGGAEKKQAGLVLAAGVLAAAWM